MKLDNFGQNLASQAGKSRAKAIVTHKADNPVHDSNGIRFHLGESGKAPK